MGATTSSPAEIKQFCDIIENMNKEDFIENEPIIQAAGNIRTLNCISNVEFQKFYLKEPNNIIMLIIHCINTLYGERKLRTVLGAVLILSKLLPVIGVSYNDISELAWLLDGEESVLERLIKAIKEMCFQPGIMMSSTATDPTVWIWEKQDFDFENSRFDSLAILNFACSYEYFFENNPEYHEKIKKICQWEPEPGKYFLRAIMGALTHHFSRFYPLVLNYLNWALRNDPNIIVAAVSSNTLEILIDLAYSQIEKLNSLISFSPNVEAIEVDLIIAILQIILHHQKAKYDIKKVLLIILRALILANDLGHVTTTQRIYLTLLLLVTSNKSSIEFLAEPLTLSLGTKKAPHGDTLSLAILEATFYVFMNPKGKELRTLCLGVIHNIATTFVQSKPVLPEIIVSLIQKTGIREKNETQFKSTCTIVSRVVTFGEDKDKKREDIKKSILKIYDLLEENQKKLFDEVIEMKDLTEDFPMTLTNVKPHFNCVRFYLKQLFMFRNKISLFSLKKNLPPPKAALSKPAPQKQKAKEVKKEEEKPKEQEQEKKEENEEKEEQQSQQIELPEPKSDVEDQDMEESGEESNEI
ncbi:hypothetical protein TVAG_307250 [Trichomonas vaginalis G3]|uniref:Uncharacterized protein n=1 Tax=Trichomonas vaginalis (strain ATCC PRA-98 / G3) TaxID=412133 RepID=A2FMC9_TRIV3|nr:armadillo (ARM) repeat-containing protein family [Trichomonas vaginalis G3]EAX93946.1 hypothetical protein TVAG_307250 [Trichomonas vaginalis G3]KAI5549061.1 armadillo (ARM) repeat-containing protein family [Trichomonas vaginalis G3]|eukprot:XP_001306876.1 hypothetical protein [Trichomonas vaginalis G3]